MDELAEYFSRSTDAVRDTISLAPTLPLIDSRSIDHRKTLREVWEDPPDEIRSSVESFLTRQDHFNDVVPRLVVLSFLRQLALQVIEIEPIGMGPLGLGEFRTKRRPDYWKALKYVVRLVDPEALGESEIIKWEIVNACAVEDWDLASRLYAHLKVAGVLREQEFRALRGELHFTAADWDNDGRKNCDEEPSLSRWYPTLEPDVMLVTNKILEASKPKRGREPLHRSLFVRYSDAANDLKVAVELDATLPLLTHLMLAKASLLTEDYLRAGKEYEYVLGQGICREWGPAGEIVRRLVYESAAESQRSAGRPKDAMRLLQACMEEFPKCTGVWPQIAQLQIQDLNYEAAGESIRREAEINRDAQNDPAIKVLLALAPIRAEESKLAKIVDDYVAKNEEADSESIDNFIRESQYHVFKDRFTAEELVRAGESTFVEFKSTLRVNLHTGTRDEAIEHACLKTIAAFLNSRGGALIIGVNDNGQPLGLEKDAFKREDQMGLHLTNIVNKRLGAECWTHVHQRFESVNGTRVLVVACQPSNDAVYLRNEKEKEERFYIRTGAATTPLPPSRIQTYMQERRLK